MNRRLMHSALLIVVFGLAGCISKGQTVDPASLEFQQVRSVEGQSKDQIYTAARSWMAERFTSSNEAIQMQDRESAKVVANAEMAFPANMGLEQYISMNVIFEAREGRFRLTARDFHVERTDTGEIDQPLKSQTYYDEHVQPKLDALADDLARYAASSPENEDW